ncbi:MAG TPA: hypothetical protein VMT15_09695 [Bryobacteraceae bacterium]|nr:hypothetical protein [Bryobacteraceae bacterium]
MPAELAAPPPAGMKVTEVPASVAGQFGVAIAAGPIALPKITKTESGASVV